MDAAQDNNHAEDLVKDTKMFKASQLKTFIQEFEKIETALK